VISEIVYAELAAHFPTSTELDNFLAETDIQLMPSQPEALVRAGQAWIRYLIPAPMNPCAFCSRAFDGDLGCRCHLHSYLSDLVSGGGGAHSFALLVGESSGSLAGTAVHHCMGGNIW
jgi:hypothetical protein